MSHSNSSASESSSPPPEDLSRSSTRSDEILPSPEPTARSSVPPHPCQFNNACPAQCPSFQASAQDAAICICKHLITLHRLPDSANKEAPTPKAGTSSLAPAEQSRWLGRVNRIKKERNNAQAEVNAGFRPPDKGKARAVSSPAVTSTGKTPAARSSSVSKSKKTSKSGQAALEPVRAIYFVDYAYESIITVSLVTVKEC
jgi:hypothetical protein